MTRVAAHLLIRGALLLVLAASATLCLLVDIPFTYQAVIRAGLLPWLPAATRLQPWALLLAALALLLLERRTEGPVRHLHPRVALLGLLAFVGLGSGLWPWLTRLAPGLPARLGALGFLVAAAALPALDLLEARPHWPARDPGSDEARRLFLSALLGMLVTGLAFFALGLVRAQGAGLPPAPRETASLLGWCLVTQGLLWTMASVALLGLQCAAGFFPSSRGAEFLLLLAAGTGFVAVLLELVVFPGLAFGGIFSWVVALLLGFALAASLAQAGLAAPASTDGALATFLRPLHPFHRAWVGLPVGLALTLGLAALVALKVSRFDWNFLFQQLGALLAGTLAFATLYLHQSPRPGRHSWSPLLFATPLAFLALLRFWGLPQAQATGGWLPRPTLRATERQAGFDASARLAAALLRAAASEDASIYRLLLTNSNLPHALQVEAKDLNLVDHLTPTAVARPDIYIFVVDSLRQDYLGAYNPRVGFTPNLDRFAAESTVVPKAFTRYGATGLSEPSIWVGGMILHKQYIVPFHPMNTLQKLIAADGYQPYLSMDSILEVVVKPTPDLVRLDAGTGTGDLRLGTTLKELEEKLDQAPAGRPVFAYTQAQDLHISTLSREGKDTPGGGDYSGFYAPYAARVRRLDAQFGAFIQFLKDRGRYDRSLIVFTADHGDSLGEEGRFGHAYTLFPEIMKVPLILRVPEPLRAGLAMDPGRAAFLTDITPTLYYLLGHRPLLSDPVLGRPLFTATQAERDRARRDHVLIASSYGAVWGILSGDGNDLYIADGVNFTDHCFDLAADPKGARVPVTPGLKRRYDRLIVEGIQHLNAFYGFRNGS